MIGHCSPLNQSVLIAHPGRQHSHQAAIALQDAGMLVRYWAGIPSSENHESFVTELVKHRLLQHGVFPIRKDLCKWVVVAPILRKIAEKVLRRKQAKFFEYIGYSLFDRYVAKQLPAVRSGAVIAYENSALHTFQAAKKLGMITVLDAASIHHQAQDRLHSYVESDTLHHKINTIKDEEILLADYIVTVSDLAKQTYVDAGVPADKVFSLMIGSDIDLFVPVTDGTEDERITFIFVGSIIMRKGVDTLLAAFDKVYAQHRNARLRFMGGAGEAFPLLNKHLSHAITYGGLVSQAQLVKEYQKADCFVLPSLNDSYGMVVAEALACGVPVIVSEMVGAKDLVRDGENGWIIPVHDVDALAERMRWCIEHRNILKQMRSKARESSLSATWHAYHERLIGFMRHVVFSDRKDALHGK